MTTDTAAFPKKLPIIPNLNQERGQPANRLIIFGNEWLTLQSHIASALKLPITTGDFVSRYGEFPDKDKINKAVQAMKNVQDLSGTFGNPTTLRDAIAKDGAILLQKEPPKEIYAHIVWLAGQVRSRADQIAFMFRNFSDVYSGHDAAQRAKDVRDFLTGPQGVVQTAEEMRKQTAKLLQKLADFDTKITAAHEELRLYTNASSDIMSEANKMIGEKKKEIKTLEGARDAAWKKWHDYTITACATSVGLLILSGGLLFPIALGLGIGFGVAAAKARSAYNDLCGQIAGAGQEITKKTLLTTDLSAFNTSISQVTPALSGFKTQLESIEGSWIDIGQRLTFVAQNYQDKELADMSLMMQKLKVAEAAHKWEEIKELPATSRSTRW